MDAKKAGGTAWMQKRRVEPRGCKKGGWNRVDSRAKPLLQYHEKKIRRRLPKDLKHCEFFPRPIARPFLTDFPLTASGGASTQRRCARRGSDRLDDSSPSAKRGVEGKRGVVFLRIKGDGMSRLKRITEGHGAKGTQKELSRPNFRSTAVILYEVRYSVENGTIEARLAPTHGDGTKFFPFLPWSVFSNVEKIIIARRPKTAQHLRSRAHSSRALSARFACSRATAQLPREQL